MAEQSIAIGVRIKQVRKQRGLTQNQVAEAAGIDPKSLSRIESNVFNPTLETLQSLAKALGINIQDFFFCDADWIRLQKSYLHEIIAGASDDEIVRIAESIRKLTTGA